MTLARRFWRELTTDGWAALQMILVAIPASFALILSLPGNSFSEALVAFAPMASLAPEGVWATFSGAVAVIGIWGWWFTRNWWVSLVSATLLSAWHSLIGSMVFLASPLLPGAATYNWLAIAALLKIASMRHAAPPRR